MSIGSTQFHPSVIENEIYNILHSDSDFIVSSKEYTHEAIEEVIEYMSNLSTEWSLIDDTHPDEEGGSVSICWIENGHLHHIVINYRYRWDVETLKDEEEFWRMVNNICGEEDSV